MPHKIGHFWAEIGFHPPKAASLLIRITVDLLQMGVELGGGTEPFTATDIRS